MSEEAKSPTIAERLEAARAAEAIEEAKRIAADEARELLVLDLKAKGRAELGELGRDFDVLEFVQINQVVLLKRAEPVIAKRFREQNKGNRESTLEETQAYVLSSVVYPERTEFRLLVAKHSQMVGECALAMFKLEGMRLNEQAGKR